MVFSVSLGKQASLLPVAVGVLAVLAGVFFYLFNKPPFPKNAPKLTSESWPILGSLQFFTQRWDFYQRAIARSHSGNFSFYAGQWPVVALSGDEGRRVFFESKALGFAEGNFGLSSMRTFISNRNVGYAALLGGSPTVKENNNILGDDYGQESGFSAYFNKRLINMLKGNRLADGLPQLLKDARGMLDELAANPARKTDPFDSIYKMVFKFTMRTVACNEIANDDALLYKTLSLYEDVESAATPLAIMYPCTLSDSRVILSCTRLVLDRSWLMI